MLPVSAAGRSSLIRAETSFAVGQAASPATVTTEPIDRTRSETASTVRSQRALADHERVTTITLSASASQQALGADNRPSPTNQRLFRTMPQSFGSLG